MNMLWRQMMINRIYSVLAVFCLLFCMMSCSSQDADTEENTKISACYYDYRLMEDCSLQADDTLTLKLGDSIFIYIASSSVVVGEGWQVSVSHGSSVIEVTSTPKGYMLAANQVGYVKAGVSCGTEILLFHLNVQPVNSEIIVYETPIYQIDVNDAELKCKIQDELDSLYAVQLLDEFDLVYITAYTGDVKYYSKKQIVAQDTIVGTFREDSNVLTLCFDHRTEYDFSFEEYKPVSSIFTHYLCQDLTNIFRAEYPLLEINKVLVIARCHKTDPK